MEVSTAAQSALQFSTPAFLTEHPKMLKKKLSSRSNLRRLEAKTHSLQPKLCQDGADRFGLTGQSIIWVSKPRLSKHPLSKRPLSKHCFKNCDIFQLAIFPKVHFLTVNLPTGFFQTSIFLRIGENWTLWKSIDCRQQSLEQLLTNYVAIFSEGGRNVQSRCEILTSAIENIILLSLLFYHTILFAHK